MEVASSLLIKGHDAFPIYLVTQTSRQVAYSQCSVWPLDSESSLWDYVKSLEKLNLSPSHRLLWPYGYSPLFGENRFWLDVSLRVQCKQMQ